MTKLIHLAPIALVALPAILAFAAPSPPAPSFTAAQAQRGQISYIQNCAECHDGFLRGLYGPALRGPDSNIPEQAGKDVWSYMIYQMPTGNAGALPEHVYLDNMAFIMQQNGRRPGPAALTKPAIENDDTPVGPNS
jgi:mono/diheme cytochrome c family protein